jgi:hypothetical protein
MGQISPARLDGAGIRAKSRVVPPSRRLPLPTVVRWVVVIGATALAGSVCSTQGDTWWALRAGGDIWHHRTVSLTDHYSYTAYGDPWPDHEWLWQLLAWVLHALGGLPLLTLATGLLAGLALMFSTRAVTPSEPTPRVADAAALTLAVPVLLGAWAVRPQIATMCCFAVLLWLLRTGRWWWAPPLMLVWANLHGGVVFGGLALGAACVVALCRRDWRRDRLRPLLAVTALGALATLVTPLGPRLWHYVLTSGRRPFEQHITEWEPAYRHLTVYTVGFGVWVAGTVVLIVVRHRRLRSWEGGLGLATSLATLPLAIDASRNMSMFVLAAVPLVAHLLRDPAPSRTVPARPVLALAGVVAALAVAVVYVAQPAALGWHPMSRPAAAAIEACPGRVYTSYDSGAYLIWFTPGVPVFADNRQDPYSERILDVSVLSYGAPWRATFASYGIRCAALLTSGDAQIQVLRRAGWSSAYRDARWFVLTAPGTSLRSRP